MPSLNKTSLPYTGNEQSVKVNVSVYSPGTQIDASYGSTYDIISSTSGTLSATNIGTYEVTVNYGIYYHDPEQGAVVCPGYDNQIAVLSWSIVTPPTPVSRLSANDLVFKYDGPFTYDSTPKTVYFEGNSITYTENGVNYTEYLTNVEPGDGNVSTATFAGDYTAKVVCNHFIYGSGMLLFSEQLSTSRSWKINPASWSLTPENDSQWPGASGTVTAIMQGDDAITISSYSNLSNATIVGSVTVSYSLYSFDEWQGGDASIVISAGDNYTPTTKIFNISIYKSTPGLVLDSTSIIMPIGSVSAVIVTEGVPSGSTLSATFSGGSVSQDPYNSYKFNITAGNIAGTYTLTIKSSETAKYYEGVAECTVYIQDKQAQNLSLSKNTIWVYPNISQVVNVDLLLGGGYASLNLQFTPGVSNISATLKSTSISTANIEITVNNLSQDSYLIIKNPGNITYEDWSDTLYVKVYRKPTWYLTNTVLVGQPGTNPTTTINGSYLSLSISEQQKTDMLSDDIYTLSGSVITFNMNTYVSSTYHNTIISVTSSESPSSTGENETHYLSKTVNVTISYPVLDQTWTLKTSTINDVRPGSYTCEVSGTIYGDVTFSSVPGISSSIDLSKTIVTINVTYINSQVTINVISSGKQSGGGYWYNSRTQSITLNPYVMQDQTWIISNNLIENALIGKTYESSISGTTHGSLSAIVTQNNSRINGVTVSLFGNSITLYLNGNFDQFNGDVTVTITAQGDSDYYSRSQSITIKPLQESYVNLYLNNKWNTYLIRTFKQTSSGYTPYTCDARIYELSGQIGYWRRIGVLDEKN